MPITAPEGYLDISNATLRGSEIITTSNVGIMNANPTMALSVGSNLHVNAYSSNVLEVNGNVVAEGLKLGFIEILPSYDLAAVSNVGNVTDSTIQFSNATTAFVTTSNIEVGTANLFVDTTTGNVGVGVTEPTSKLYIQDDNANTKLTIRGGGLTVNDSNVNIELLETPSDFYGATIQYCGTLANQGLRFGHHVNSATPRFDMAIDRQSGNVGIGTTNPTAQLTLGASSGSQLAVTDKTRLFSNTHVLSYGSSTPTDITQVLLQFDTGGTSYTDQSEYAGYVDVEMVAQRTVATYYGPEIFTARLNFILGWNEDDDVWRFTTFVQENKSVSSEVADYFTVFTTVPVFKYRYVDRQLQIYVSFGAKQYGGYTSFTARVTSDNPADVSMPGQDALMASGTDGTAEVGICYGVGANAANVGIGTASPGAPLAVVSTRDAETWAADKSQLDVLNHNGQGGTYGMSFAVSQLHGDGIIQTFNRTNGIAQYDLRLQPNAGNVGIGTTNPTPGKLTVIGVGGGSVSSVSYFNSTGTAFTGDQSLGSVSIYASWGIAAGDYVAASDQRIKDNIIDVDDGSALETLRLLKPKRYTYRDVIRKGEEPVWGFIAQEVRDTLPYATTLLKETVPNIYELANVSQSNVITFTNFNTSNLESNATTLIRTKGIDGEDHDIHLAEVIDEHTIRVEEDLTEWIGSVDETGNVVAGNQLFIYGQEVDDFIFVKKEAIWTVATSALQEVDRQLQAEKARNDALEARIAALENP